MTASQPHCGTLCTGYRSGNVWSFKLLVLVFNCRHNLAPRYQPVADNAGRRHLRSAARSDLAVPATRTLRYGPCSFAVHLEFSSSTTTQLPSYICVPSWSENWTVYQSISLACLWLFLAVRVGEHNLSSSSSSCRNSPQSCQHRLGWALVTAGVRPNWCWLTQRDQSLRHQLPPGVRPSCCWLTQRDQSMRHQLPPGVRPSWCWLTERDQSLRHQLPPGVGPSCCWLTQRDQSMRHQLPPGVGPSWCWLTQRDQSMRHQLPPGVGPSWCWLTQRDQSMRYSMIFSVLALCCICTSEFSLCSHLCSHSTHQSYS